MQNGMFRPTVSHVTDDPVSLTLLRIAQNILVVVYGLFPLLFLPVVFVPFGYSKTLFIIVGTVLALIFYSLSLLREGVSTVRFPLGMLAFWAIAFVAAVSATLSGDMYDAFIGNAFDVHTVAFALLLATVASMVGILRNTKTAIMRLYVLFIVSAFVLAVFHIVRIIFGADTLTFGVFGDSVSTPLGGWNDLALYFGLTILLALVAIEQLPLTKIGRIVLGAVSILALIMLAIVNFSAVWFVLAIVSLMVLMYSLTRKRLQGSQLQMEDDHGSVISILLSVVVFFTSLVFIIGGGALGGIVSNVTDISYVEVRPSFSATVDIIQNVYQENALTGIGPNKFADAWRLYKDPTINQTIFWNTNFESGNGFITTAFATNGVFGVVAWISFLTLLLVSGGRMLIATQQADRFWRFVGVSSFVSAIYFWGMNIFFVPTASILILAAICTGIFFTAYTVLVPQRSLTLSVMTNKNLGFVFVGIVMLIIIGSVGTLYAVGQHYSGLYQFTKAIESVEEGDTLASLEQDIAAAFETSKNDVFAREIALHQLAQMNVLLNIEAPTSEQQQLFQQAAATGIQSAQTATTQDATDPINWQVLGQMYGILATAGIDGTGDLARDAYTKASVYDPRNPVLQLLLAQIESRSGNLQEARTYAEQAVAMKQNYTDAIFFLTQLDIAEGNVEVAAERTQTLISFAPDNSALRYQLGVYRAALGQTDQAVTAFTEAVTLDENFANARYFLAQELEKKGNTAGALKQLEVVLELNPGNQLVETLITRLKNGEPLLAPATDSSPVEDPVSVTEAEDGQQVIATEDSDTSLVTPVNTVPTFDESADVVAEETPAETIE